jgi:hypothetical protein
MALVLMVRDDAGSWVVGDLINAYFSRNIHANPRNNQGEYDGRPSGTPNLPACR